MISSKRFQYFYIAILVSFTLVVTIYWNHNSFKQQLLDYLQGSKNELDGCYHVFLDVGSNIGNTVRKLYEPHLFSKAEFLPIFDEYFGRNDVRELVGGHSVCAVGFEPNANFLKVLKDIEVAYKKCGWKTKFYTKTAASHKNGQATFYADNNPNNELGASIVKSKIGIGSAKLLRLSDYILKKVITRKLPDDLDDKVLEKKPSVVMKLDIEGSELEVLTDLLVTGSLQHIDLLNVEYHPASFNDNVR